MLIRRYVAVGLVLILSFALGTVVGFAYRGVWLKSLPYLVGDERTISNLWIVTKVVRHHAIDSPSILTVSGIDSLSEAVVGEVADVYADLLNDSGVFTDYWGRELVPIVCEGTLTAIGSKGENGVWDHGYVDDVVMSLEGDVLWSHGRYWQSLLADDDSAR